MWLHLQECPAPVKVKPSPIWFYTSFQTSSAGAPSFAGAAAQGLCQGAPLGPLEQEVRQGLCFVIVRLFSFCSDIVIVLVPGFLRVFCSLSTVSDRSFQADYLRFQTKGPNVEKDPSYKRTHVQKDPLTKRPTYKKPHAEINEGPEAAETTEDQ